MNGKRQWFLWVAMVLIWVLGLAACSPGNATSPVETEEAVETPAATEVVVTETITEAPISSEATEAATGGSEVAAWSPEMDCSSCHSEVAASTSDPSMLSGFHAAQGTVCTDCHDADVLVELHAGNALTEDDQLATTAKCQSCHGSYADLKALTTGSTAIVDGNGNTVNPHDTHKGEVDCYNCHIGHRTFDPYRYCKTCHHDAIVNCNTCHDE